MTPRKDTGRADESTWATRNGGHVLELLADAIRWSNIAAEPEAVRDPGTGRALALLLRFEDGDTWTVATTPHRAHGEPSGPAATYAAKGTDRLVHFVLQATPEEEQLTTEARLTEEEALAAVREVWPDAHTMQRISGGWSFMTTGGFGAISYTGIMAPALYATQGAALTAMRAAVLATQQPDPPADPPTDGGE